MTKNHTLLELKNVTKRFGQVVALKDISFHVDVGEVVGLVGENGAGKSTLMKLLNGIHTPTEGQVNIAGAPTLLTGPAHANELGIGMVFQEQSLIPNLTVAENIFLGGEEPFLKWGRIDWSSLASAAAEQLAKVGLDIDPLMKTEDLGFMHRQMVELAKVLTLEETTQGGICILLDEPTSVLEQAEIDVLFGVVRDLKHRAGIIFVSHRLDEVIEISDRIYVLKDGEMMAELDAETTSPGDVHQLMVGRGESDSYYKSDQRQPFATEKLLSVQDISRPGHYSDITFDLHKGEVLALVGVDGCGAEDIMRSIFGFDQPTSGRIICGKDSAGFASPQAAVRGGVGYVPRERKIEGVVEKMSVGENIVLAALKTMVKGPFLDFRAISDAVPKFIAQMHIKTPNATTLVESLSGGNQQKVVLARWLNTGSKILLLDHPTRGLDIGAKEDVFVYVRNICADGGAVLLIGDTLEEALGLAHTIIVLNDGRETARFDNTTANPPKPIDLIRNMV